MNYREVAKKLSKLGCEEIPRRGGGSHRKWFNHEDSSIDKLFVSLQIHSLNYKS
jgi:predicted RNA binding protein YcfA (HicA-like mRNA interferase family)